MKYQDKKLVLLAMVVVTIGFGGQARANSQDRRFDDAWRRVFFVESSNGQNSDAFVENHCRALGIAQITPIVVRDVNRILRCKAFSLTDRLDWKASREMFNVYCKHYYPNGTVEQMCRLWYRGSSRKAQWDKHGDEYWGMCKLVK